MIFDVKIFNSEEDIFKILGWDSPLDKDGRIDWNNPGVREHDQELWDAGFNLDDWDIGFASKVQLHFYVDYETENKLSEEELKERYAKIAQLRSDSKWEEADDLEDRIVTYWKDEVYWLGSQMESYCAGYNYCYFGGYHWYTVHHS